MQDGPFNDVATWHYHRLPELLGAGRSFVVTTEGELDAALEAARADTRQFALLEARLDPHDHSPALRRLTARLARRI